MKNEKTLMKPFAFVENYYYIQNDSFFIWSKYMDLPDEHANSGCNSKHQLIVS